MEIGTQEVKTTRQKNKRLRQKVERVTQRAKTMRPEDQRVLNEEHD